MDNEDSGISWSSEDEDDEPHTSSYACTSSNITYGGASSSNPARSKTVSHFTAMGFSEELVVKVIDENGEGNEDRILETLLSTQLQAASLSLQQVFSTNQQQQLQPTSPS